MVSCDEMRDHLFQMLAPKYFRKWKQRHQVYFKCAAGQAPRTVQPCAWGVQPCHVERTGKAACMWRPARAGGVNRQVHCMHCALCCSYSWCKLLTRLLRMSWSGQGLARIVPDGSVLACRFRGDGRAVLIHPAPFTHCTQCLEGSGAWMFPVADSAEWLCARPAA